MSGCSCCSCYARLGNSRRRSTSSTLRPNLSPHKTQSTAACIALATLIARKVFTFSMTSFRQTQTVQPSRLTVLYLEDSVTLNVVFSWSHIFRFTLTDSSRESKSKLNKIKNTQYKKMQTMLHKKTATY